MLFDLFDGFVFSVELLKSEESIHAIDSRALACSLAQEVGGRSYFFQTTMIRRPRGGAYMKCDLLSKKSIGK